jgi:ppGpp synthetase/RelA/SpoT-type nucleotidyltranferase
MPQRAVEDWLRAEYFELLPDIRRVVEELEAEVRHSLLPMSRRLERYEQLVVKSRVKECESAIDALRRNLHEGRTFDQHRPEPYTLKYLNDLAGVRVMVFPRNHLARTSQELRRRFPSWTADPVREYQQGPILAETYYGYCEASGIIRGEIQIVPMLTGLFWEVEHAAIYQAAEKWVSEFRRRSAKFMQHEVLVPQ